MADCQAVLDIRNDLAATMDECREVTEQYSTGRSAYLRLGQLFMRLFAGLLSRYCLLHNTWKKAGYRVQWNG